MKRQVAALGISLAIFAALIFIVRGKSQNDRPDWPWEAQKIFLK